MITVPTALPGVLVVETARHRDARGWFGELYRAADYTAAGIDAAFVQDNASYGGAGVLRGLHFQHPRGQAKLISVLRGEVFDVAVDVRAGSPTFGRWVAVALSEANGRQLYVPAGFAHGFLVVSDGAVVHYRCSDYYQPGAEQAVRWNDPDLGIRWPREVPLLGDRDREAPLLRDLAPGRLPPFDG